MQWPQDMLHRILWEFLDIRNAVRLRRVNRAWCALPCDVHLVLANIPYPPSTVSDQPLPRVVVLQPLASSGALLDLNVDEWSREVALFNWLSWLARPNGPTPHTLVVVDTVAASPTPFHAMGLAHWQLLTAHLRRPDCRVVDLQLDLVGRFSNGTVPIGDMEGLCRCVLSSPWLRFALRYRFVYPLSFPHPHLLSSLLWGPPGYRPREVSLCWLDSLTGNQEVCDALRGLPSGKNDQLRTLHLQLPLDRQTMLGALVRILWHCAGLQHLHLKLRPVCDLRLLSLPIQEEAAAHASLESLWLDLRGCHHVDDLVAWLLGPAGLSPRHMLHLDLRQNPLLVVGTLRDVLQKSGCRGVLLLDDAEGTIPLGENNDRKKK